MYIKLNGQNKLLKGDYEKPIINSGYPNYDEIDINKITIENFISGELDYENVYIHVKENNLDFISMPRAPHFNIFYMQGEENNLHISDDFFKLITACSQKGVNFDKESIDFFFSNGYYQSGKTAFIECKRLIPGAIYIVEDNNLKKISKRKIKYSDKEFSYNNFEKKFESTIEYLSDKNKVGVMLSGGVDSTSVAIALSKFNRNIKSYTMRNYPKMNILEKDIYGAKGTSLFLGIEHKTVNINFEKLEEYDFAKYVKANPMATHLSVTFDAIIKCMMDDNIQLAFTGQNLDTLYNFGPTTSFSFTRSGLTDFFRRFYLTSEYTKSIDLYNKKLLPNLGAFALKNIGELGASLFSIYKGKRYYPPRNNSELVKNYKRSVDYVTFSKNKIPQTNKINSIDISNVHYHLLKDKIENYIMSGDSQVIRRAGDLYSVRTFFPFSTESMMNFWSAQTLNWKDLLMPKRFIHMYVKKNYPDFYKRKSFRINSAGLPPHDWANEIINLPLFKRFEELKFYNYTNNERTTPMQKVQQLLSSYWFHKSISILEEKNVKIIK